MIQSLGLSDPAVQSLASRLLQSSFKEIPPLSKMTTSEWQRFGGRKLVRIYEMLKLNYF